MRTTAPSKHKRTTFGKIHRKRRASLQGTHFRFFVTHRGAAANTCSRASRHDSILDIGFEAGARLWSPRDRSSDGTAARRLFFFKFARRLLIGAKNRGCQKTKPKLGESSLRFWKLQTANRLDIPSDEGAAAVIRSSYPLSTLGKRVPDFPRRSAIGCACLTSHRQVLPWPRYGGTNMRERGSAQGSRRQFKKKKKITQLPEYSGPP